MEKLKNRKNSNYNKHWQGSTRNKYSKNTTDPTYEPVVVKATSSDGILENDEYTFTKNGIYEFTATDKAGNVTKEKVVVDNILTRKEIDKRLIDENSLDEIIDIANLNKIHKITSNIGDVDYSVNGKEVGINITDAKPTDTVLNERNIQKKRQALKQIVVIILVIQSPMKMLESYKGHFIKMVIVKVINGSYTPAQTRIERATRETQGSDTTPESISYDKDGYKNTL